MLVKIFSRGRRSALFEFEKKVLTLICPDFTWICLLFHNISGPVSAAFEEMFRRQYKLVNLAF